MKKAQCIVHLLYVVQDSSAGSITIETDQVDVDIELKNQAVKAQQASENSSKIDQIRP